MPEAWYPLKPALPVAVQLKVVPATFDVSTTGVEVVPAQISCESIAFVTDGIGFTVTTRFRGIPGQLVGAGPLGVITYVTSPVVVAPAGNDKVLFMSPLPLDINPLTVPLVTVAVQVNVAVATLLVG